MKNSWFIFAAFPFILFSSCAGSQYFYQPNKNTGEIVVQNATITHTFISNEKHKKISVTHLVSNNKTNDITILVIPPNGGNSTILAGLMQPLVDAGYAVYLFDYEGYGKSEGKANHSNVLKDGRLVLESIIANQTPNEKLLLWGFSLGGNLAVKLASEHSTRIDALVIEAAFTSHQDIAKALIPKYLKWLTCFIRSPYSSRKLIKEIHLPVFIAHSTNDHVCPFSMGQTLYQNANSPKFFLPLSGEHCYGLLQETDKYMHCLANFLNQNNIQLPIPSTESTSSHTPF